MQKLPEKIHRFQIKTVLGRGNMGEVFHAFDPVLERDVALKVIRSSMALDDKLRQRFLREAQAASGLHHSNIVAVYDAGESEGLLFIVMEYIGGEDLQRLINRKETLSIERKLQIMIQVVDGVACAHKYGIVHRDLKPANILIDKEGNVKVADFGLARTPQSDLTEVGTMLGTPHYMSPEQIEGANVDERSDLFALGSILYELLTFSKAFPGHSVPSVLYRVVVSKPEPLDQYLSGETGNFQEIIDLCLEKDPAKRIASCDQLGKLLRKVAAENYGSFHEKASAFTSHARPSDVPSNLPQPKNKLLGRESEIAMILDLLIRSNSSLITLTGAGGSGKTRLAIEVARRAIPNFPDGIYFVELDSLSSPSLLASHISGTLNIRETNVRGVTEEILAVLRERVKFRMLLVLDSFEKVIENAAVIGELLNAGVPLQILATSRERLNIYGEREFPVPPLPVPPAGTLRESPSSLDNPAVQLFNERAEMVKPGFKIHRDNAAAVIEICRRLDGLPLAIELAAARVKLFSPEEIAQRLGNSLQLLTSGPKDLPERQRSLEAAISWSYDSLSDQEKKTFLRLAAFRGEFSLEAVEAICADLGTDTLESLLSLVDKSLLRSEQKQGETRFSMLTTLQEYAFRRLKESADYSNVCFAHATYALHLAEKLSSLFPGTSQKDAIYQMETQHDNFRVALQWYIDANDIETGARLALAMWQFWQSLALFSEGRQWLGWILHKSNVAFLSDRTRRRILYAAGVLAEAQGDYVSAKELFEENLAINRRLQDDWGIANSLNNIALIAERQADFKTARALFQETLEIWKRQGLRPAIGLALTHLGNIAATQNEFAPAKNFYEQSLEVWKELGDQRGISMVMNSFGDLAYVQNNFTEAFAAYQQALNLSENIGDSRGTALSLSKLGMVLVKERDFEQAQDLLLEAFMIQKELQNKQGLARVLENLVLLNVERQAFSTVAILSGAATAIRDSIGSPRTPAEKMWFDQTLAQVRKALGAAGFTRHWLQGMSASIEVIEQDAVKTVGV